MAHGFLTPTPVSGDRFWQNAKWLWEKLRELKKRKAPPEEVVPAVVSELQKALPPGKQKLLSPGAQKLLSGSNQKALTGSKPANMLQGAPIAKMLGSGKSEITIKQQAALPPGGPKLPPSGGASPSKKGGTFTNIPGVSAAPKKLDADAFFKAAQTGVHPETGQYLSSDERKEYLKKSKSKLNASASVASAASPGISSASSITKGDEAIVGSVDNLSHIVTTLVDAVKSQTAAQKQISEKEQQKADTLSSRALAKAEEKSMAGAMDNSGTLSPVGGIGGAKLGGGATQGGMGGPGFGLGGKVIANAVGKRGIGRMATRAGAHLAGKQGAKMGAKLGGKLGLKAAGIAGKKIPLLGLGLGGLFAVQRAMKGDWAGAGMELASGAASTLPGIGTAASIGLDAALMAKDAASGDFAGGGLVTGGKKSVVDDVKINADEGEVVMSNAAGNTFGRSNLMAINAMAGGTNKPTGGKSFAGGGLVGGDASKSKKMFTMFGEGMIDAQKKNSREYAKIQSAGLKQYYENEDGGKKLAKSLADVWKGIKGFFGGLFNGLTGGAAYGATGNPADYLGGGDFSGSSGQNQAMNYFMSQGLSKEQAAGIVGNLMQESTGAIDPKAKNASGHRGIAQWDKNRWGNFEKWAKTKGLDVNTREAQLQWIMEEMRTGAGGLSLKTLKGAKNSRQAAELFLKQYERSGEKAGSEGFENRMKNAARLASMQDFGSTLGTGTTGSKLENDILAFRKARSKFGVSANRVATNSSFNLAIRDLRGAAGGSSINPLADDKAYEDVHKGDAHKKGYGFDVPIANREQAEFVINFWRTRGYETIHGRGDDPSGGHDHHVHVQAPKSKAKEFMMAMKPPAKPNPPQGVSKPTTQATKSRRSKADLIGAAPANQNTGNDLANTSAQTSLTAMGLTAGGTNVTNVYNTGSQQSSPRSNALTPGASAASQIYNWKAARR